jgi:hypothetical protein
MISVLLGALAAYANDAKTVTVTNHTGQKASDLHIIFRGTGGDLTVDPTSLASPANCEQGTPSTAGNELDIVWQPGGCVDNGSAVSFRASTSGPGPLDLGGGYWTGPGGKRIGDLQVADVALSAAPNYRLLVPEIAEEGQKFTGMVVEETPKGYVPVAQTDRVVFNGQVLPQQPGGQFGFPPFERKLGNYFIGVAVVPHTVSQEDVRQQSLPISIQHMEILPKSSEIRTGAPEVARASSVIGPGAPLRVEGRNLQVLQRAALVDQQANQITLGDSVGSSLQRIYLPSSDTPMPAGTYRYVAWDAAGKRYEAPNTSQRPRMQLSGPPIKTRGQHGEFTVLSDTNARVELSGGQPIISLDERMIQVRANEPRKVKFTSQQVGQYSVEARMFSPEDLPPSAKAPRVNSKPEPVATHYDPQSNRTSVDAPVDVIDATGKPVANVPVDVALSHPNGVEYARVTTDSHGRANLTRMLSGDVPANAISTHVYRVIEHTWKGPEGGIGGGVGGGPFTVGWCQDECKVPQVGPCTVDHIHITPDPAVEGSDVPLEETIRNLDFVAVVEGVTSVVEPSPASGASGATLGVTEAAKGLVEQVDKRKDLLKSYGPVTIKLVMHRSRCVRELCFHLPIHQNVWRKETFDRDVKPPAGLEEKGKWAAGAYFDLRNADVRQALKDAYEKAKKDCEVGGQTADRGSPDFHAKATGR